MTDWREPQEAPVLDPETGEEVWPLPPVPDDAYPSDAKPIPVDFGPGIDNGVCTMCGKAPATTTYGYPVCRPCHDWLVDIDGHLAEMEAIFPDLAEAARKVDEEWRRLGQ